MRKFFFFLFLPVAVFAVERAPWYERDLVPILEAKAVFETYHSVDSSGHSIAQQTFAGFYSGALRGSYAGYAAELEVVTAHSRHRGFGMDSVVLTGRYRLLNDIVADPLSVVLGLTATSSTHAARHDMAAFHHGGIDLEGFVSAGKELSCRSVWLSSGWGVFGVGGGDLGSPWMRFELHGEKNFGCGWRGEGYLKGVYGFGGHRLVPESFYSWGPIRYRAVDVGVMGAKETDFWGIFSVAYERRVWAWNFPRGANVYVVRWTWFW